MRQKPPSEVTVLAESTLNRPAAADEQHVDLYAVDAFAAGRS